MAAPDGCCIAKGGSAVTRLVQDSKSVASNPYRGAAASSAPPAQSSFRYNFDRKVRAMGRPRTTIMPIATRRAVPIATVAALLAAATPQGAAAEERNRTDVQALTRAYNASGQALFRDFSTTPGNIVFSPYSIGTAMAMALAGTRGETEREMAAVLQHTLGRAQINDANASAMATLNGYDKSDTPPTCPPGMRLAGERRQAAPT